MNPAKQKQTQQKPAVLRNREDLLVSSVACFELTVFSVDHDVLLLDAVNDLFPEQALRSEKKKNKCQHIRKPDFNTTTHHRAEVHL